MPTGLKAKEILAVTLFTLLVVAATSLVYLSQFRGAESRREPADDPWRPQRTQRGNPAQAKEKKRDRVAESPPKILRSVPRLENERLSCTKAAPTPASWYRC